MNSVVEMPDIAQKIMHSTGMDSHEVVWTWTGYCYGSLESQHSVWWLTGLYKVDYTNRISYTGTRFKNL